MSVEHEDPVLPEPREFARLVKRTSSDELLRLMQSPRRAAVLDELFRRMLTVFRPDRAGSLDAVIHWRIGDRPDGGRDVYELTIAGGTCTVSGTVAREPRLVLTVGAVDFLRLVTGNAHAVVLVMKGKLRTKGDLALSARFPLLFDVPKV